MLWSALLIQYLVWVAAASHSLGGQASQKMGALPLGPDISLLSVLLTTSASAEFTLSLALTSKLCGGKEGSGALCCSFSWRDLCFLLV